MTIYLSNDSAQGSSPDVSIVSRPLHVLPGTHTHALQPNVRKWATDGFIPVTSSSNVFSCCEQNDWLRVLHAAYRYSAHNLVDAQRLSNHIRIGFLLLASCAPPSCSFVEFTLLWLKFQYVCFWNPLAFSHIFPHPLRFSWLSSLFVAPSTTLVFK